MLPTELHDEILQYLTKEDLPNYRLVCRDFAEHGAIPLFQRVRFTTSLPSLRRLVGISNRPIGACVKTLVWDTNGSEYEAESFFEGLRMRELSFLLGQSSASHNESLRPAEGAGQDETKQALSRSLGVFVLQAIFTGFSKLRQIYILTGRFPALEYEHDNVHRSRHGKANEDWYPTKEAYKRLGKERWFTPSTGKYEFQTALLAAHLAGCSISKLRVGYLRWAPLSSAPGIGRAYEYLTSLRLVLEFPSGALGTPSMRIGSYGDVSNGPLASLKHFLDSVPNLRNFELQLAARNWWEGQDHSRTNLRLQDIIPSAEAFPQLRKLILHQVDTSESFFASFLHAHCETLKILSIHSLRMNPPGSWPRLVENVQSCLRLDTVVLVGNLYDDVRNHGADWWAMDGPIGRRLEGYLLQKEDFCPIHQGNKWIVSCRARAPLALV